MASSSKASGPTAPDSSTWYERLTTSLLANGFTRGQADQTLFIKNQGKDKIIAQIYVDEIIFGATLDS
jgi:hypothetical protein